MNLTYAGTHLTNGKPDNGSACVTGFDQAGFIMGTSASLFNVSNHSHRDYSLIDMRIILANLGLCAEHDHRHV